MKSDNGKFTPIIDIFFNVVALPVKFILGNGASLLLTKLKLIIALVSIVVIIIILILVAQSNSDYEKQKQTNNNQSSPATINNVDPAIIGKVLNVPYFNQWVDRDGGFSPRNMVNGNWELGWMICGAASSTMVAGYFGKIPYTSEQDLKEYSYSDKGQGLPNYCRNRGIPGGAFGITAIGYCNQSSAGGISAYMALKGLRTNQISTSFDSIVKAIKAGHPVILSIVRPVGHIMVIKGYTNDQRVIVNDPYTNEMILPRKYSLSGENAVYDLDSGYFSVNWMYEVYQP